MSARKDSGGLVHNQPYDETVEVSDGEEVTSNNATPRGPPHPGSYNAQQQQQPQQSQQQPQVTGSMGYQEEEEEDSQEQSESEESGEVEHATLAGAYDPAEFEHLAVSNELKELFQHISRYTPQNTDLECKLKPFIPEYIPAIGDIDAFLKVTRPDGQKETCGLNVLDEPSAKQTNPTVLDLQLRATAKQTAVKPVTIHSITDPEKQTKMLDNWINSISDLHRSKPPTNVHYTKNMPDIEVLMQEWPAQFEASLKEIGLPLASLNCDLAQYADIICALLDIPVHQNRVHSLHVLFSLYLEFKNSQHFKELEAPKPARENEKQGDSAPTAEA
ncbi:hypothetical protein EMCRGX_G011082 [Ephydatia muelleri]